MAGAESNFPLLLLKLGKSFEMSMSESMTFTFSVVIPTCDRGALLQRSLDCVLAQTMIASEIILVDNGREAARIHGLDPRVRVLRTDPLIGPGRARNIGAQIATGELVAFLDDDDIWQTDYLERVMECFQGNAADAVLGCLLRQAQGGAPKPYKLMPSDAREQRQVFWRNPGFGGQNLIIRRDVFLELGGFDESMPSSEDRDLAARLLLSGKRMVTEPRAVAILCDHSGVRASNNLIKGNWIFLRKHWLKMRSFERYQALKILLKRRILHALGL